MKRFVSSAYFVGTGMDRENASDRMARTKCRRAHPRHRPVPCETGLGQGRSLWPQFLCARPGLHGQHQDGPDQAENSSGLIGDVWTWDVGRRAWIYIGMYIRIYRMYSQLQAPN